MRTVAVIGPGRVGGSLALVLQRRGERVRAVAGREGSTSLDAFARLVPDAEVRPLEAVADGVDLVLVCTPDDVVGDTARRVAAADGMTEGQRWVHTSGGHGIGVLSPVVAAGGRVAACHPAMTFPDPVAGADQLGGASWAVTAADADLGWAHDFVVDLGGAPVTVHDHDRTLYHAALAVGSNATTAVVTMARDLLLGAGIEDPAAFLGPLVTASAMGGATRGVDALTGPVRRGDAGTVAGHLDELAVSFPEAVGTYVALADLVLLQAVRAGLDSGRADTVRRTLDGHRT